MNKTDFIECKSRQRELIRQVNKDRQVSSIKKTNSSGAGIVSKIGKITTYLFPTK
jgi:hypothetical protein